MSVLKWFIPQYVVRVAPMGGELYYMIYFKRFGIYWYLERWNTVASADIRLSELKEEIE